MLKLVPALQISDPTIPLDILHMTNENLNFLGIIVLLNWGNKIEGIFYFTSKAEREIIVKSCANCSK